jgi:parvulin-like peptidyl-prolyl isomerase
MHTATVMAQAVLAQTGDSGLDWHQRFLGIIPLVKPSPSDPIVAKVNGVPITLTEVNSYSKTEARLVNATSTAENKAVWQDALDNLIGRQLLIEEATHRKVSVSDAEVAQRAREFRLTEANGQEVSSRGAPDPALMREVRATMEIESMLDREFAAHSVKPTAEAIRSYYDEHKDLFVVDPGEIRLSHIAVKLPADATEQQKKQALDKIKQLRAEAEKTRDFAALARRKSEDSLSASKGGELGYFRPGQLPPVVEKAAFSTRLGHLSQILGSNIGYSFMKVTERRGATYAPLKDVQPKIALVLLDYNQDLVVKALIKSLKKKAKIEFPAPPPHTAS